MPTELEALNEALPNLDWLEVTERKAARSILTPLDKAPEPRNSNG